MTVLAEKTLRARRVAAPLPRTRLWLLDLGPGAVPPTPGSVLDAAELARASRFINAAARNRFVIRRMSIREVLADELGCRAGDLAFTHGPAGKPAISRPGTALQFSVSSSGDRALLAIAAEPIGVDIEWERPELADFRSVTFFLTPRELDRWSALSRAGRTRAYFECWTRKEAVAKALGIGVGALDPPTRELCFAEVAGLASFRPVPGFHAALATGMAVGVGWR